jgi:hypothetical protein
VIVLPLLLMNDALPGTIEWMAPELLQHEPEYSKASDWCVARFKAFLMSCS